MVVDGQPVQRNLPDVDRAPRAFRSTLLRERPVVASVACPLERQANIAGLDVAQVQLAAQGVEQIDPYACLGQPKELLRREC